MTPERIGCVSAEVENLHGRYIFLDLLTVELKTNCHGHGLQLLQKETKRVRSVHLRHATLLHAILADRIAIADDGVFRRRLGEETARAANRQRRRIRVVQQAIQNHLRRAMGNETADAQTRTCQRAIHASAGRETWENQVRCVPVAFHLAKTNTAVARPSLVG